MNYYNENDPFAADWLRELIKAGHIPDGFVDTRSIEDVRPSDLDQYTQCHFFAGIGGWSLALRMAGWPDDRPVWTGSCPCQPFSKGGKRAGLADSRHLWPDWHWLISQCRPPVIFGEQVASKLAGQWWDNVAADLEHSAYSCAAINLCAASVGAPHVRQRLFWGAVYPSTRHHVMGNADGERLQELSPTVSVQEEFTTSEHSSFWAGCGTSLCHDGKIRATKPGICAVANGVPNRVGTLRGAGNSIVPQVAAKFICSFATL